MVEPQSSQSNSGVHSLNEVFISYSRRNSEFVAHLKNILILRDIDPWFDKEDIPYSSAWWQEIRKGIENAYVFIFVISPASVTSQVCNWELDYAIQLGKRIIPIQHIPLSSDDFKQVQQLRWATEEQGECSAAQNWAYMSKLNFMFMADEAELQDRADDLVKTLQTDLAKLEIHTRTLIRALDWVRNHRQIGYLMRGDELKKASAWLIDDDVLEPHPTELHLEYIQASQQDNRRRQVLSIVAASIGLITFISLGIFAYIQNNASEQQQILNKSRSLRNVAAQEINQAPDLSLLLSVEAYRLNPSLESQIAITEILDKIDPRLSRFLHVRGQVIQTAFSDSGKLLATGTLDGQIAIWETETGLERYSAIRVSDQPIVILYLSFSPDEKTLAVGLDRHVRLIDIETGQEKQRLETGVITDLGDPVVKNIVFSPDGRQLAGAKCVQLRMTGDLVGQCQDDIFIWDINDPQPIYRLAGHRTGIGKLQYSQDGQWLASSDFPLETDAAADFRAHLIIWDTQDYKREHVIQTDLVSVNGFAFTPDTNLIVAVGSDGTVVGWDIKSFEVALQFSTEQIRPRDLAFLESPNLLLIGTREGYSIWDWQTKSRFAPAIRTVDVNNVAAVNSGIGVIAMGTGSRISLWSVLQTGGMKHELPIQDMPVNFLGFVDEDRKLIIASSDGNFQIWDAIAPRLLATPFTLAQEVLSPSWALSADTTLFGQTLLTNRMDTIRSWNVTDWTQQASIEQFGVTYSSLSIAPNNNDIVYGTATGELFDFRISTQEHIDLTDIHIYDGSILQLAFRPDGQELAVAAEGRIFFWDFDAAVPKQLEQSISVTDSPITRFLDLQYSPDGQSLFISYLSQIDVYDRENGNLLYRLDNSDAISAFSISPNGNWIATGDSGGNFKLWDIELRQPIYVTVTGELPVEAVAFSQDSRHTAYSYCFQQNTTGQTARCHQSAVRIQLAGIQNWIALACKIANRPLSQLELQTYQLESASPNICLATLDSALPQQ